MRSARAYTKVKGIQLYTTSGVNLKRIPGKKVVATGRLWESVTGHDHTDVTMEVEKIVLSDSMGEEHQGKKR